MHSSPRPAPASLGSARTRHRVPLRKCSRAEHPVVRGAKQVASNPDEILHDAMDGREALQVAGRFEAPHLMFALAGRLMRDLGPVVRIPVGHMADGGMTLRRRRGSSPACPSRAWARYRPLVLQ